MESLADLLGIHWRALREWVGQDEADGDVRAGTTIEAGERIAALERGLELLWANEEGKINQWAVQRSWS
ncbi:hypothetical protein [Kocuria sp. NPDC057446]|uniref:hypothetical protein n=1 Tax=Kocuria sp. NPDC057446 TaxID=3346137 RepID=UPI0036A56822